MSGSCPYGKWCCFIHTELPTTAVAGTPPAETPTSNGLSSMTTTRHEHSSSMNSEPNNPSVSLLTRITNQHATDAQAATNNAAASAASILMPTEGSSTLTYQFTQQQHLGMLCVNTMINPQLSMKQNTSVYPYTNNHPLPQNNDHVQLISPIPMTAGPDLGRSSARFDVVRYNERYNKQQQQVQTPTNT